MHTIQSACRMLESIARYHHRRDVFADYVTMHALALQNSMRRYLPEDLFHKNEERYKAITTRHTAEDLEKISEFAAVVTCLLEKRPADILGAIFMAMDFGNRYAGQVFTPDHVSRLMAELLCRDHDLQKQLSEQEFITLHEPACGAGGMIMATVATMMDRDINFQKRVWVKAQDVDSLAAMMCYIQMSLWSVPGVVVIGNSFQPSGSDTCLFTPAHFLGNWERRLAAAAAHPPAPEMSGGEPDTAHANQETVLNAA